MRLKLLSIFFERVKQPTRDKGKESLHYVLAILVVVAFFLPGHVVAQSQMDASLFFGECPNVEVATNTVVKGSVIGVEDCTVSLDQEVELVLINLDFAGGVLEIEGGVGLEIKKSKVHTTELSIHTEGPVAIKESLVIASGNGIMMRTGAPDSPLEIENSELNGRRQIVIELGSAVSPITIRQSKLTSGGIICSDIGGCVLNPGQIHLAVFGANSPIEVKKSELSAAREIVFQSFGFSSPMTIKASVLETGLDTPANISITSFEPYSPVQVIKSKLSSKADLNVSTNDASSSVRIRRSIMSTGNVFTQNGDANFISPGETMVKRTDFTGVVGEITISGGTECKSINNTPNIPCS